MPDSQTSGPVVVGRYRLIKPLGHGGMGIVWRAMDELLKREVAVKELRGTAELTGPEREEFTTRTFREARAAGRLSHPSVVAVYDVFQENGRLWIVMQLVPSRTLGSIVREEGPLPPQRVAEIGVQLLAALRVAHGAGVLHRDVKPDNVLITGDGRAVLTDFGIAALEDDSPVTRTGMVVGTPPYMAPERAAGGQAKRASDLWSLGVTLFFAVEGRSPFERGHALATLAAVVYDHPGQLLRAGPLTPIIEGLLIKDPARRLTARAAARRLQAVAEGRPAQPMRSTVPGPVATLQPVQRRRRWGVAAVTGALTLLVGIATGGVAYVTARNPGSASAAAIAPTVTVFKTRTAPPETVQEPSTQATPQPSSKATIQPATAPPGLRHEQKPRTESAPKPPPKKKGKGKDKGKESQGQPNREGHKKPK